MSEGDGEISYRVGEAPTGDPIFQRLKTQKARVAGLLEEYLSLASKDFSLKNAASAARKGDELLEELQSWKLAAQAIRGAWEHREGSHFEGLLDPTLDLILPEKYFPLLEYAREVALWGCRS